jgi:hypothetical protein
MLHTLKRLVIGRPIASADEGHQRLPQEDRPAGLRQRRHLVHRLRHRRDPARAVIVCRPASACGVQQADAHRDRRLHPDGIVVTSYRQTIHAYPGGGGSYIVSKENLGTIPALVAGSSLLVDYILTVAVSVAGGVLAMRTAFGFDTKWTVPVCAVCVMLMTLMNLRGVKESGALFALPRTSTS